MDKKEKWQVAIEEAVQGVSLNPDALDTPINTTAAYMLGERLANNAHYGDGVFANIDEEPMHVIHEEIFAAADRYAAGVIAFAFDIRAAHLDKIGGER